MFRPTRRFVTAFLPLSLLSGCAWILYPERRFQTNPGPIEVVPLVVDCLLFIPGIVPGIIALAVDFGTRAIYVPRGHTQRVEPGEVAALGDDVPRQLELRLLDVNDRELTRTSTTVDPDADRQSLALHANSEGPLRLELHVDGRPAASARLVAPA